jgi:nucleoside-diphosphate-sugar epimerase
MTRVMVNGATGLVGENIVRAFLEAGHTVRASDRPGSDFSEMEKLGVEIIPAQITDPEAVERTVEGMDIVVHVAGIFDFRVPRKILNQVNHLGVRTICEAVLKKAPDLSRFVQVSTVGTYGRPVRSPCREDDPKNPRNNYEKTKWLGEMAAFEYYHQHGLPVTAIRPTLIYGPKSRYGHAMFIALMAMLRARGLKRMLSLKSGPMNHHVHVEDVAQVALLVAESPDAVGQAFNAVDRTPVDGPTFVRALAEPLGLEVKEAIPYSGGLTSVLSALVGSSPLFIFDALNRILARRWSKVKEDQGLTDDLRPRLDRDWIGYMTADHVYDFTRIEKLGMNWKHPDFVEGMKETIEWYKQHEWIP